MNVNMGIYKAIDAIINNANATGDIAAYGIRFTYYAGLAKHLKGAKNTLLFSWFYHTHKDKLFIDEDGSWLTFDFAEASLQTGLTTREISYALKELIFAGVLEGRHDEEGTLCVILSDRIKT